MNHELTHELTGVGLGWRPETNSCFHLHNFTFVEVIAESLCHGMPEPLEFVQQHYGIPVIPHGVKLSLASASESDLGDPSILARAAELTKAPFVSEHMSFSTAHGTDVGHLVSPPMTKDQIDVIARNYRIVQDQVPVPIALEHVSALVDWPESTMREGEFATEVIEKTGALLLLDVANVFTNSINRGLDPHDELAAFPLERIAYCHVAGGHWRDGRYVDSHTDPVGESVLELLGTLRELRAGLELGPVPVMIERDGRFGSEQSLVDESCAVAVAAGWEVQ